MLKGWGTIVNYIDDRMSVIPVRDKDETNIQGEIRKAKTPYSGWKAFQTKRMSEGELYQKMDFHDTTAVAIITGSVSENLEIIDVDSKYYDGISSILFDKLESLRPDVWRSLRIHKTPSGGFHLLYRIFDRQPEGNQKLAGRFKTDEEIKALQDSGAKHIQKIDNFLETRGEGGYFLAPPSMSYEVYRDVEIPYISWADRCDIIAICRSFNEAVKPANIYKPSGKKEDSVYTEDPWQDYSNKVDCTTILTEYGWKICDRAGEFVHLTRPDKQHGISGSVNINLKHFKAFTTSTDFDPEKVYSPVDILCLLRFNKDRKETFKYLVSNGYGTIKPQVEKSIIRKSLHNGGQIPPNLSESAKKQFEDLRAKLEEEMPHGIFWNVSSSEDNPYKINRKRFYDVCNDIGYRLYKRGVLTKIDGNLIDKLEETEFYGQMCDYVKDDHTETHEELFSCTDAFLQRSGKYVISRLGNIEESLIKTDGRFHAFKYYNNCYIKITADDVEVFTYDQLDGLIFSDRKSSRDYNPDAKRSGLFVEYLKNATGYDDYCKSIIGYLAHEYKSEAEGYCIVLTEKVPDPKDGGGSGKNIFGNMFKQTTSVKTVSGAQVSFDVKFLQPWNYQKVYFLADIPQKINWKFLKEMVTGTGTHKKLYKDEYDVEPQDMPKILLNTNYSYDEADGGLKRRIRQLEFSDFYTLKGGVDQVHGKLFPNDFETEDWADYDAVIIESLQQLFKKGGKIEKRELSETGWRKKFDLNYGKYLFPFLDENISDWLKEKFIANDIMKERFADIMREYDVPQKYQLSFDRRVEAIDEFCKHRGHFVERSRKRVGALVKRGLSFSNDPNFKEQENAEISDGFGDEDDLPF